jgi:hypothetical protein
MTSIMSRCHAKGSLWLEMSRIDFDRAWDTNRVEVRVERKLRDMLAHEFGEMILLHETDRLLIFRSDCESFAPLVKSILLVSLEEAQVGAFGGVTHTLKFSGLSLFVRMNCYNTVLNFCPDPNNPGVIFFDVAFKGN